MDTNLTEELLLEGYARDIIRQIQARFAKKYPRIRFSFGIQSFDNEVLTLSGRKSLFLGLVDFLRGLQPLKTDSTVFNFDFIAFGQKEIANFEISLL